MKVKLIEPHYFSGDLYYEAGTVLSDKPGAGERPLPDNFAATFAMEGLDTAGTAAVEKATAAYTDPIRQLPLTMDA